MTFRNIAYLFLSFLLLTSCKGLNYYNSATNPAGISVILQSPATYYTNLTQQDSVSFYVVNHNSEAIVLSHWWTDLFLIGQSRFYTKEVSIRPQPNDLRIKATTIEPYDTAFLIKVPITGLLGTEKTWLYKSKNVWGPHLLTAKKFHPYIYFTAELSAKVPNQEQVIKIRSEKIKVTIAAFKEPVLKTKNVELGLSSDVKVFDVSEKKGTLVCSINNLSEFPIQLFSDPGSVRFKLYGYSPNRTSVMFTQFVLDNGKLPVDPLAIGSKSSQKISIPLEQVLFITAPEKPVYYWSWNKKQPPVSPLVYGKNEVGTEVEFWFGVVVDGKEYLSNTMRLAIQYKKSKSTKKTK